MILQLNQLAQDSGITFDQITPGASLDCHGATTGYATDPFAAEPIQVQFSGSFYDLVTFLQRLRNLVRVEHGRLARLRTALRRQRHRALPGRRRSARHRRSPATLVQSSVRTSRQSSRSTPCAAADANGDDRAGSTERPRPPRPAQRPRRRTRLQPPRARAEGLHEPQEENAERPGGKGPARQEARHRRCSPARDPTRLGSAALPRRWQERHGSSGRDHHRCGHDRPRATTPAATRA